MARLYEDFIDGTLSASITSGDTTISSAEFADLPEVAGSDTLRLVLDPQGRENGPEVVIVTAHTAASTSVTATRGADGTTAVSHSSGAGVVLGVLASDVEALLSSDLVTAKGDLYVATASGTVTRLAVGSDGQALVADSAQTEGVKWGTAGRELLAETTLASTNIYLETTWGVNPSSEGYEQVVIDWAIEGVSASNVVTMGVYDGASRLVSTNHYRTQWIVNGAASWGLHSYGFQIFGTVDPWASNTLHEQAGSIQFDAMGRVAHGFGGNHYGTSGPVSMWSGQQGEFLSPFEGVFFRLDGAKTFAIGSYVKAYGIK